MKPGTAISVSITMLVLSVALAMIPFANADSPNEFEQYGPHVDDILIKLYPTESAEFAAFEAGEIDLIDTPLTKYWVDRWADNPEISMMNFGEELGAYEFDLNLNQTMREAGPTGAIDGTQELSIAYVIPGYRHALAHLIDRAYVVSTIMQGFAVPLYSMVPQAMGGYMNPNVLEMHPYDPVTAASILAASGIVDSDADGFLNWPAGMMGGANIELDFVVRDDHSPGRKEIGDRLIWELTTNLPGAKFNVTRWSAWGSIGARGWWMEGKVADIYTGGWSLSKDPDYLFNLYHSSMYWHPGRPPNVGNVSDLELDGYLEGIYYAQDFADAKTNTWEAQRVMAERSLVLPIYSASAPVAVRVNYTGGTNGAPVTPDDGENMYRGREWKGFVNEYGKGLNSWWTSLNAHPEGYELSPNSRTNRMTVRYGFKVIELNSLNPVYGDWLWDWEVMGKVYDSLIKVNPYDPSEDLEWMAYRWQTLVWDNAGSPATELVFDIRNDIYFHDGVQITAEDLYFTFVELVQATEARELPYPWYYSNLLDVNSIIIESPFKVRVRMNSLSVFAFHWVGGNIVLPKHIWGPIFMGPDMTIGTADDNTYNPETFSPDPQLIGQGPFQVYPNSIDRTDYYRPGVYVRLRGRVYFYSSSSYWGFSPNGKTGGTAQVSWNKPGYLSVWKLNWHVDHPVSVEEYVVIGDGLGAWKWWDEATQTWVTGSDPILPPNPPDGIVSERNLKPNATGTNPGLSGFGSVPGIFIENLPVPSGTFGTLVQNVVVLERDTCTGPNGVYDGGGDDGPTYPWRMFQIVKPQPAVAIEGDITDDSIVDIEDFTWLSVKFGQRAWVWTEIDVNNDMVINLLDAAIVIRDYAM